jgi:phosphomannomutase
MKKITFDKQVEDRIKSWLKAPYDEETRREVQELVKMHPEEASDAFSTEIHFGTAGMRAKMGPGSARMNKYTIHTITQGLANYILSFPKEMHQGGVVVCHDPRLHSREFAEETARVLAGNGIPVHLVPSLRPTPFASFALRYYKAISAVNITASHNPKEYNGYKVYWSDGGQVVAPHDTGIVKEIEKITSDASVKLAPLDSPLISLIPKEVDDAYLKAILDLRINSILCKFHGKELKIIYSPLNGAGNPMIPNSLNLWGFSDVHVVEEQKNPDGNFPTTPYPNPETEEALALGWRDLTQQKADILLVSDPDSDRLSCSILHIGKPHRFTGNELGILLLHYLIQNKHPHGHFATITTIVSSSLIKEMTERHHGTCFEVLTGFKYIGEKIHEWETEKNGYTFLFGMEESLGYLYGTHARDKDATIAACLTAELTLHLKREGRTLLDQLYAIYSIYGIHRERQLTIESKEGLDVLVQKMTQLRKNPPKTLCNIAVTSIEDYQTSKKFNLLSGQESTLSLPKSNVLVFRLEDKSKFILRPSGTEPKLKIYGQIIRDDREINDSIIAKLDKKLDQMLQMIQHDYFS